MKSVKGIVPPLVTPLLDDEILDLRGLERLIEHQISGGVHGLFLLGTTGEGPSLKHSLRIEFIKAVCNQVAGRIPILVGITDTSLTDSLQLSKYSADQGADAVVAAPPYYFQMNQQELIHYFQLLADKSTLPLFLYNIPSHTKVSFEPETVRTLANHPNIIGLKDSSGDLIYFQKVVQLLKVNIDFSLLVGPEEMLMQSMLSGGHGGVNGGANMFPKLYVSMYDAAIQRDFKRMMFLQRIILQISSSIYYLSDSSASYLQGLKCTLSCLGICSDKMVTPYKSFGHEEKQIIEQALKRLELEKVLSFG